MSLTDIPDPDARASDLLPPEGLPSVLVVDDDEIFLHSCSRILSIMGYDVHRASNGSEALELLKEQDYRLLLLDVRMPDMDGISCLRELRRRGSSALVIMLTGVSDVRTIVEAMKAGADDFMTKPFPSAELITRIESLLRSERKSQFPPVDHREPEREDRDGDRKEGDVSRDAEQKAGKERRTGDRRRGDRRRRDRRQGDRRWRSGDPIVAHIRENADRITTRKDVADALATTPEQVSEHVQRITGQFFRQFLHTCRVEQARTLLETTDLSIAEVAAQTGFATVQHFSRIFSNIAGLSPRRYRQEKRG